MAGRNSQKARKGALVGIAISALLLYFLLRGLNWGELFNALAKVNYLHAATFLVCYLMTIWARAVRWRYLLPAGSDATTETLASATLVGGLATFVLPLRAGEIVRPLALSRWSRVPFSTGFATIVTERIFDVLAILVLLGFALTRVPELPQIAILGAKALGVLTIVIIVLMVAVYLRSEMMTRIFERVLRVVISDETLAGRLRSMFDEFLHGIKAIRSGKELALIVLWSLVLWLNMAVYFQVGMWAMGFYPNMVVGVLLTVLVALAIAAPSAPGFVGTYQAGCVAALETVLGYSHETAIAYSIVVHGSQVLLVVLSGLAVLYLKGVGLSELRRAADEAN